MLPSDVGATGRVAVLLSTRNGARFLREQLASLRDQTVQDWVLYWRDDMSSDATPQLMAAFIATLGASRVVVLPSDSHAGASSSFLLLLRAAWQDGRETVAFCDQDDVWLPEKLGRGIAALDAVPSEMPALYCACQILVDADLRRLGQSASLRRAPGFPAALTENVATGCTLMMNRAAAALVVASRPPVTTLHDWWCYLLVAAAGGQVTFDPIPVVLYRQHSGNLVGAPSSLGRRGVAALRRGPGIFMNVFRGNLAALADQHDVLSPAACQQVARLAHALDGGVARRLRALCTHGLVRQTWIETMLFRVWFLLH